MQLDRWDIKSIPDTDFDKGISKSYEFLLDNLRKILNKGIRFSDNHDLFTTTITTNATPGNESAISHGLKRVPIGCIVAETNKAAHLYLGPSGKSASIYNIASDVATVTATVIIF